MCEALAGPLDWPDLTHGAAGQGVAALICGDLLQAQDLAMLSRRCAEYLIARQDADGGWTLPHGVEGLAGVRYTGFAHGTAGIIYFLAAFADRFRDEAAMDSARAGASWLKDQARAEARGLVWPMEQGGEEIATRWCHGAPGIALAFLKLYSVCGERPYADVARGALDGLAEVPRSSNLTQCCGLSGIGEVLLEGYHLLHEEGWLDRAAHIADLLCHLADVRDPGGATWTAEPEAGATAELMVGSAGLAHFLLRFAADVPDMGPPLLVGARKPS
jgi:lantibiotic modifying enzyme